MAEHEGSGSSDQEPVEPEVIGRLRVQQFEVVDAQGRPRVVIDGLSGPNRDDVVGVHLLDRSGNRRLDLMLLNGQPVLSLAREGNDAANFGVHDSGPDNDPASTYLTLCDGSGATVVRWEVFENGKLQIDMPESG